MSKREPVIEIGAEGYWIVRHTHDRVWREGDREPADHPPLIDDEGVTWLWGADSGYERQKLISVRCDPTRPGVVLGVPVGLDWEEILAGYGPMREATRVESTRVTLAYRSTP